MIRAESLALPEPLIAHELQNLSADLVINGGVNVTVPAGSDANAVAAAVRQALDAQAREQRAALQSALND